KGAVQRLEPHFICRPLVSKQSVQAAETNNLINKIYDGSAEKLFAALLGRQNVNQTQIDQLRQLVEEWPDEP
ncbi:MAG: BlaI/MecI/CopY family transcriptional regulator, partial [Firmicutes bacterium]|nr:BlaI/MecI/CopY family transcriptional regulator [Bacillota bacterium]